MLRLQLRREFLPPEVEQRAGEWDRRGKDRGPGMAEMVGSRAARVQRACANPYHCWIVWSAVFGLCVVAHWT
eukprot:COSAG05_NODE_17253_length_328_cov_200.301310_1_plen_71_part_10